MTNQQAPETLADPSPDQLRAIARTARNSSGSASDDCGTLAYVLHGWRAAAIAFRAQQATLVDAQQPAQSPAAAVEWIGVSSHHLLQRDGILGKAGDVVTARWPVLPQPSPTPQADSQAVLDSLALMKVVMRADEALAGRCTRGTTNWAAAIGKAVQDAVLAARAPADSVTAPAGGVGDDVDAIALARYKVVPANGSMFHRFAVVAGDGKQQLYLGREVECENMARKFAGAFLDGAFYQSNIAPTTPTAASIAWTALRDLTDPLGEAGVKIMGHVRIYAQRQYEAGLTEGRATPPTASADSRNGE